jgi:hypothetical protein
VSSAGGWIGIRGRDSIPSTVFKSSDLRGYSLEEQKLNEFEYLCALIQLQNYVPL